MSSWQVHSCTRPEICRISQFRVCNPFSCVVATYLAASAAHTGPILAIVTDSSEMMQINVAADKRDPLTLYLFLSSTRTHTHTQIHPHIHSAQMPTSCKKLMAFPPSNPNTTKVKCEYNFKSLIFYFKCFQCVQIVSHIA